jgi:hypothetical protein
MVCGVVKGTCIVSGACVPMCPVDAILPEGELVNRFPQFVGAIRKNAEFFGVGSGYQGNRR